MEIIPGKILYQTKNSDILDWYDGKILKLYKSGLEDKAQAEIKVNLFLGNKFFNPEYFENIIYEGRTGLVFEKLQGLTLVEEIYKNPHRFLNYASQLALLQSRINEHELIDLPDLKEELKRRILIAHIEDEIKDYTLNKLMALPQMTHVCHGDLNLSNVIKTKKAYYVVDWSSASKGDPAADIARVINNLSLSNKHIFVYGFRTLFWKSYLIKYSKLKPGIKKRVSAWKLPVAVASLGVIKDHSRPKFQAYKKLIHTYYKTERT